MPLDLDVSNIDTSSSNNDFAPMPDGKYCATVFAADDQSKTSAAGHEYECVNVQYRICSGEFTNRRVFKTYIYSHPSEKCVTIGKEGLAALFTAQGGTGNATVDKFEQSDTCVQIVLRTEAGSNGYDPKQVVGFVNKCKQPACADGGCASGGSPSPSASTAAGNVWDA